MARGQPRRAVAVIVAGALWMMSFAACSSPPPTTSASAPGSSAKRTPVGSDPGVTTPSDPADVLVWGIDGVGPFRWGDPLDEVEVWLESLLGPAQEHNHLEVTPGDPCSGTRPGVHDELVWSDVVVSFRDAGLDFYSLHGLLGATEEVSVWGFSIGESVARAQALRPGLEVARLSEPAGAHWHIGEMGDIGSARVWGGVGVDRNGQEAIVSAVGVAPGHLALCND